MIKIKGHENLYKNETGTVVNADYSSYLRAKERKKEKNRINMLEERLERIESLLQGLINNVD